MIKLPALTSRPGMSVARKPKLPPRPSSALPNLQFNHVTYIDGQHSKDKEEDCICSCQSEQRFTHEGQSMVKVMITIPTCLCDKHNVDVFGAWGEPVRKPANNVKGSASKTTKRPKRDQVSNTGNYYHGYQSSNGRHKDYVFRHCEDSRDYMAEYRREYSLAAGYTLEDVPDPYTNGFKYNRDWLFERFLQMSESKCQNTNWENPMKETKAEDDVQSPVVRTTEEITSADGKVVRCDNSDKSSLPSTPEDTTTAAAPRTFNLAPVRAQPNKQSIQEPQLSKSATMIKKFSASSSYMNLVNPKISFPLPVQFVEKTDFVRGSRATHNVKVRKGSPTYSESSRTERDHVKLPKPCSTDMPASYPTAASKSYGGLMSNSTGNLYNFHRHSSSATSSSLISNDSAYVSDTASLNSRLNSKSLSKSSHTSARLGNATCRASKGYMQKPRAKSDNSIRVNFARNGVTLVPATGTT